MRKSDKLKNIEEINRRLLKENTITETHVDTDEGKIDYIKGALKNLSSENLNKIYLSVEKYDPKYERSDS